jgi:ferredoxin
MKRRTWPLPPRPSTRAFIAEARRTPGFTFFDWLHGYVYARWPYLYIGIGTGEHPLTRVFRPIAALVDRLATKRPNPPAPPSLSGKGGAELPSPHRGGVGEEVGEVTFADTYHGKVITLEAATRLVSVKQEVELRNLEHVIPYALARDIVLKSPDHIVALECPCRANRANPCLPLDVCLIVGEPFASFVAEHHGRRSRWITSSEAAAILAAEHDRGHVHHAFFKDAMLGRFYAICNCCSCCCGAMQAQRNGVPMLTASGYVSQADPDRCIGCGTCVEHCQFEAISVNGNAAVDRDACMGCGVCVDVCEQGALALVRDKSKGIPLELAVLMREAMAG